MSGNVLRKIDCQEVYCQWQCKWTNDRLFLTQPCSRVEDERGSGTRPGLSGSR